MSNTKTNQKFEQVVQKFYPQSKLLNAWELKGGLSAEVTALEMQQPDGQIKKVVVRQHNEWHRQRNPQIAADEFKLLQILQTAGIAVPTPEHLDQSGEIFTIPYLIMEFIEGQTEFAPANLDDYVRQLAVQLANIHAIDQTKFDLSFLSDETESYAKTLANRPAKLDESLNEGRIRDVLEATQLLPQSNQTVLLHNDFWPGNVMWQDGQIIAVLDWENAELGDPLLDVSNTRFEIMLAFGSTAMENFTNYYRAITEIDISNLPYWDLCAALRPMFRIAEWAGDAATEKKMREGHYLFITQAFAKLTT